MHIKVLGTGCPSSRATASVIEEALGRHHMDIPVERVEDNPHISLHAVHATPAVLIDGIVVHEGSVPTPEQVDQWLEKAAKRTCGCAAARPVDVVPIVWQRLVDSRGETCPRCEGTGKEVARAVERLKPLLAPLGLVPQLELRSLDEPAFREQPLESNRILVAGRPIEYWIGASAGSSPCCAACGDADCRTVELPGRTFEVVPADLLVEAVLAAAGHGR